MFLDVREPENISLGEQENTSVGKWSTGAIETILRL